MNTLAETSVRERAQRPSAGRILLFLMLLAALAVPGRGASFVEDARDDDEFEERLEPEDVHQYAIRLVAGSELRLDFEAEPFEREEPSDGEEGEEDEEDEEDEGDGEDRGDDDDPPEFGPEKTPEGPAPTLRLLDQSGAELLSIRDFESDPRAAIRTSGVHRVVVVAGEFAGEYALRLRVRLGEARADEVEIGAVGEPVVLDVPLGARARIDVRRLSGASPEVVAVRDGAGRALGFRIRRQNDRRVRLRPIQVPSSGGLTVVVRGRDGQPGTCRVRVRLDDDDDEDPDDDGHEDEDLRERHVVLQLGPGVDPERLADELDVELVEVYDGFVVVELPEDRAGSEFEVARETAIGRPDVIDAEAERTVDVPEGSQSNAVVLGSLLGRSDFDRQSAFQTIHTTDAHQSATGAGLVVAVLDTGVDPDHPLLADRLLAGRDFVDDDDAPFEERNGLDDDGDGEIDEGYGHGTFVAGLVLGVAPDARILPLRVLDSDGRGDVSRIAAAIYHAQEQGAHVINLSLGAREGSDLVRGAVRFVLSHDVLVVAAAGNGGRLKSIDFPGGVSGVVAVSAVDGRRRRAPFTNGSRSTALSAPGVDLIGPYPEGRWATWSGTSFATALVSGAAALARERDPAATALQLRRGLTRRSRPFARSVTPKEQRALGGGALDVRKLTR